MAEFNPKNPNGASSDEMLAYLVEQTERQGELLEKISSKQKTSSQEKGAAIEIDVVRFLSECMNRWLIIAIFSLALTLAVLLVSLITYHPVYTSTVKLYVNNVGAEGTSKTTVSSSDITASKNLVDTYSTLLRTNQMLGKITDDLSAEGYSGYTIKQLMNNIKCGSVNNTEVFYVTVSDGQAENAEAIAEMIGRDFPAHVESIISGASAKIVDPATSAKREGSGIFKKAAIAFISGIVLSMAYIFVVRCVLNDSVESVSWITESFPGIPLLAEIPDATDTDKHGSYYRRSSNNE